VRANFSLLSSIYDLSTKRTLPDYLLDVDPDVDPRPLDALPDLLRKRGYHTVYYYPGTLHFASEGEMLRYVGFEVVPGALAAGKQHPRESDEQRLRHEREFFERVNRGLGELSEREQPFLLVAATRLGHAPYPDVRPAGLRGEALAPHERVTNLVEEVDDMIGSVIERLRALDLLSRTILVITGDHGVRNISDDPTLDMRFANSRSFHVPLLIHYPPAFPEPVVIDEVTSHVDITPTLAHLLGIESPDYLHQGLPLYDRRIAERATFFLGGHYIGSNAVHYDGTFFMVNEVTQLAFASDAFRFSPEQLVTDESRPRGAEGAISLRSQLGKLSKAQMALTAYLRGGAASPSGDMHRRREAQGVVSTH
jgi:phosphoglycerol transferase MdoB-like AlkP superfamily enzyme